MSIESNMGYMPDCVQPFKTRQGFGMAWSRDERAQQLLFECARLTTPGEGGGRRAQCLQRKHAHMEDGCIGIKPMCRWCCAPWHHRDLSSKRHTFRAGPSAGISHLGHCGELATFNEGEEEGFSRLHGCHHHRSPRRHRLASSGPAPHRHAAAPRGGFCAGGHAASPTSHLQQPTSN